MIIFTFCFSLFNSPKHMLSLQKQAYKGSKYSQLALKPKNDQDD